MKKNFFALVLVLAMLLSCMLMLTSCPEETPNVDDTPTNYEPNVDESLNNGTGSSSVYPVTDPTDPEAGAGTEGDYIHG